VNRKFIIPLLRRQASLAIIVVSSLALSTVLAGRCEGQVRREVYSVRIERDRSVPVDVAVELHLEDKARPSLRVDDRRVHPNEIAAALAVIEDIQRDSARSMPATLRIARREGHDGSRSINARGARILRMLQDEIARKRLRGEEAQSILVVTQPGRTNGRVRESDRRASGVRP
jgi:hypothetical protein